MFTVQSFVNQCNRVANDYALPVKFIIMVCGGPEIKASKKSDIYKIGIRIDLSADLVNRYMQEYFKDEMAEFSEKQREEVLNAVRKIAC